MTKITPCLWFDGNAEDAIEFYCSVFPGAEVLDVMHYGEAGPGRAGKVMSMTFRLAGQEFIALNGGPHFTFSPAISFFIACETQAEVDALWDKLLVGGAPQQCGWLTDRFGLSWQIVPKGLHQMLQDPNPAKANATMSAMLGMVKLDIDALRRAYEQA